VPAAPGCGTILDMDESTELQHDRHWRLAVWALRVGFGGLSIVLAGLIVAWLGDTAWVLAVGMFIWLACAVVMAVGFLWSRHGLPEPRPGFWSMRFMLIHDTVSARPSAQGS
jgi:O-antigen/teichoic acid export membrane protein